MWKQRDISLGRPQQLLGPEINLPERDQTPKVNKPLDTSLDIGILGHVGNRNLGDEALIAATIVALRNRLPNATLRAYTANPGDTALRHNLTAYPLSRSGEVSSSGAIRQRDLRRDNGATKDAENSGNGQSILNARFAPLKRLIKRSPRMYRTAQLGRSLLSSVQGTVLEAPFLFRSFRRVRGLDILLVAGSQQLIDYINGPWGHLYTLLKWTLLARLGGSKVAFLSCGAGPIQTLLGRRFAASALRPAAYRSFRDQPSIELVETLGVAGANHLAPDLAYSICPHPKDRVSLTRGVRVVAINPVPFGDADYWVGGGSTNYQRYVEALAAFSLWLIQQDIKVALFPTQLNLDPPVIRDIFDAMLSSSDDASRVHANVATPQIDSLESLFDLFAVADVTVASRFHGVILSLGSLCPTLGIAYHEKTRAAMAQMGCDTYCIDIVGLTWEHLRECYLRLLAQWDEAAPEVARTLSAQRKLLEDQFDTIAVLTCKD